MQPWPAEIPGRLFRRRAPRVGANAVTTRHSPVPTWSAWRVLILLVLSVVAPNLAAQSAANNVLDNIKQRGEILVGVKTDFAPFGHLDSGGHPVGFEIDLAGKLAAALGVRLRTVSVSTANRFERLEQGSVDLIIATAGDTLERRKIATAIEPNYYAAGVSVLLRPEQSVRDWSDIRGKTLCAVEGAYFNRAITQRYILDLQMYRSLRDALVALKEGHCIGLLYTDTAILQYLTLREWAGYKAPLASALLVPWSMYISRSEQGSEFERLLGDFVAQFHRDGDLIALEKTWGLPPSKFLREQRELWRQRTESGARLCERDASGAWPLPCRNRAFVTVTDTAGVGGLGLWIKNHLDLDLSVLYDPYDGTRYVKGIVVTALLIGLSALGSLVIGYFGAQAGLHGSWLSRPILAVASYARMTPPLLQMYMMFFGVSSALDAEFSITTPAFVVALLSLSIYHGSMIMNTLVEAAQYARSQCPDYRLTLKTLNDIVEHCSVGVRTALLNLSKAVTIASAIAVPEVLSATMSIIGDQGNRLVMMNLLLVIYFLLTTFWLFLLERLESRLKHFLRTR